MCLTAYADSPARLQHVGERPAEVCLVVNRTTGKSQGRSRQTGTHPGLFKPALMCCIDCNTSSRTPLYLDKMCRWFFLHNICNYKNVCYFQIVQNSSRIFLTFQLLHYFAVLLVNLLISSLNETNCKLQLFLYLSDERDIFSLVSTLFLQQNLDWAGSQLNNSVDKLSLQIKFRPLHGLMQFEIGCPGDIGCLGMSLMNSGLL